MCDIYEAPCKVCGVLIEMHLEGYNTERSEIEIFCYNHIPKENVVIWKCKLNQNSRRHKTWTMFPAHKEFLIGVRALTENAKKYKYGNSPNLAKSDIVEERN